MGCGPTTRNAGNSVVSIWNAFDLQVGTERLAEVGHRFVGEVLIENKVARAWVSVKGVSVLENWSGANSKLTASHGGGSKPC